MVEAITATYVQQDADWTITVSGSGKQLTARAPGIIAARDRADQLVEQLEAEGRTTVVHLLNGSALEFTSTYMTARLTLPKLPPLEVPPPGSVTQQQVPQQQTAEKAEKKPAMPPSKQLPKAVEDRKKPATPPARESKAAAKKARA